MLVVLNNQAFILYLFSRRKKEELIDKGYLKEHSIGALKIMHKVLGDIIEDHPNNDPKVNEGKLNQELTKNVISISNLASKRKK